MHKADEMFRNIPNRSNSDVYNSQNIGPDDKQIYDDNVETHNYVLPNNASVQLHLPPKQGNLSMFQWALTHDEHEICMDLLVQLSHVCRNLNISCIMNAGTLLGSYRHLDMIPWDDDVDVLYQQEHKPALFKALNSISEEYVAEKAA